LRIVSTIVADEDAGGLKQLLARRLLALDLKMVAMAAFCAFERAPPSVDVVRFFALLAGDDFVTLGHDEISYGCESVRVQVEGMVSAAMSDALAITEIVVPAMSIVSACWTSTCEFGSVGI